MTHALSREKTYTHSIWQCWKIVLCRQVFSVLYFSNMNGNSTIIWFLWHDHPCSSLWNKLETITWEISIARISQVQLFNSIVSKSLNVDSPWRTRSVWTKFKILVLQTFMLPPTRDFDNGILHVSSLKLSLFESLESWDISCWAGKALGFLIGYSSTLLFLQLSWNLKVKDNMHKKHKGDFIISSIKKRIWDKTTFENRIQPIYTILILDTTRYH